MRSIKSFHLCKAHHIGFKLIKKIIPLIFSLRWTHVSVSPSLRSFASNIDSFRRCPTLNIKFIGFWRYISVGIIKTVEIDIYRRLGRLNNHGTIKIFFVDYGTHTFFFSATSNIRSCSSFLLLIVSWRDESLIVVLTGLVFIKKVSDSHDLFLGFYLDVVMGLRQTRLSRIVKVIFNRVFLALSLFRLVL